jgi:hypothetical protein
LTRNNGLPDETAIDDFLNAGYSQQQALEVILGLAVKLMSNYTNSIAKTPLDRAMLSYQWQKPED